MPARRPRMAVRICTCVMAGFSFGRENGNLIVRETDFPVDGVYHDRTLVRRNQYGCRTAVDAHLPPSYNYLR